MVPLLPPVDPMDFVDPVVVVACGTYAVSVILPSPPYSPRNLSMWFCSSPPVGPVVVVVLLCWCLSPPAKGNGPLYGDSKAVRCLFSTLRHRGAGSPHTTTLSSGHHALVVGHVTALAGNSKLHPVVSNYAVLVILLPPLVLRFW